MSNPKHIKYLIFLFICNVSIVLAQDYDKKVSRSFEVRRYVPLDAANGETDFKGENEVMTTDQRVEFLSDFASFSKAYYNDENLDTKVVSEFEVDSVLAIIKPQPQPKVRKRILLNEWESFGQHKGSEDSINSDLKKWQQKLISLAEGTLQFDANKEINHSFKTQKWRFFFDFDVSLTTEKQAISFHLKNDKMIIAGIDINEGNLKVISKDITKDIILKDKELHLKFEVDLETGRYNVFCNDKLIADFVSILNNKEVTEFFIGGSKGVKIDNIFGLGFIKKEFTLDSHSRDTPFYISTFIDQDFELPQNLSNWTDFGYSDQKWKTVTLPHAHGGDRNKEEALYLRKKIKIPKVFHTALLNVETLDPGGEIWVNGQVVYVTEDRHPIQIDVSKYLKKGQENILALKVFPYKVTNLNRHTPADHYTGWFAGRAWMDFVSSNRITDVFSYTSKIDSNNTVTQKIEISLRNEDFGIQGHEMNGIKEFDGFVNVKIYPWFPEESFQPILEKDIPVNVRLLRPTKIHEELTIPDAKLWTPNNPHLYKIVCELRNNKGDVLDDFLITTGIRIVSQEGGTFRINGKPDMMNGALLFGYKSPIDKISQWLRASPYEWLVKEILMLKKMNGNTFRMSVHQGVSENINDPRLAELGDQLGIMYQWATTSWVRTGSPWLQDFDGLSKYVLQVRNHPSIVMWQPSNHPLFKDFQNETIPWVKKIYESIYPNDPSRLINPVANNTRSKGIEINDEGTRHWKYGSITTDSIWTAPMITRGDMEHSLGYGSEWTTLRMYPDISDFDNENGWRRKGFREDYLNSKDRAYFDFESEETIGQPNWNLRKGKPEYKIQSYEYVYDEGSIGRNLTTDEWQISQAWQAISGFEAYKKKRWLDYDGLAWCSLHGGGNTATYQKPIIDYYGHAKLCFYALKTIFQKSVAGSANVDMVYGTEDELTPIILHIGEASMADLKIRITNTNGKLIDERLFENIKLSKGRISKKTTSFLPKWNIEGNYKIEYELITKVLNK